MLPSLLCLHGGPNRYARPSHTTLMLHPHPVCAKFHHAHSLVEQGFCWRFHERRLLREYELCCSSTTSTDTEIFDFDGRHTLADGDALAIFAACPAAFVDDEVVAYHFDGFEHLARCR